MAVTGHIDECGWDVVRGWAWDPDRPSHRIIVNVAVNDIVVGSVVADRIGDDLAAAGFGDGAYRFRFELQPFLVDLRGTIHDITVVDAETGLLVGGIRRISRLSLESFDASVLSDVMAQHVLHGTGIEIGALDNPQRVGVGVLVHYVDRYPTDRLRAEYPEIEDELVEVTIVDDGAALVTVLDHSYDFVIASNVIEHVEDPVAAIVRWTQVLRPGGVLFLMIPNCKNSIDSSRAMTSQSHFELTDVEAHRFEHYLEWATSVDGLHSDAARQRAELLDQTNYSIHFHVWYELTFAAFLHDTIERLELPLELEMLALQKNRSETLAILRKARSA
jgi:SAM-dependent methyltransferase